MSRSTLAPEYRGARDRVRLDYVLLLAFTTLWREEHGPHCMSGCPFSPKLPGGGDPGDTAWYAGCVAVGLVYFAV